MKKIATLLLSSSTALAFGQDPVVQGVIDAIEIDSMMHYVVQMDGEVPVDLGAGLVTIVSRNSFHEGNAMAQTYFEQRFAEFGYTPVIQSSSATGRNILVTKPGIVHPDTYVILCAHYDALPGALFAAPAADDDASGCAAVLEAARILRDIPLECSVIFALWDEEEQGKLGSDYYAGQASGDDLDIRGVVNMDAIAYDGDGDGRARVHSANVANSSAIADTVLLVNELYGIGLDMVNNHPGATYSDHASFWESGYGAVLMIQDWDDDHNPNYHETTDLTQDFDVPYYERLAKLSIASAVALAVPWNSTAGVRSPAQRQDRRLMSYPNPTAGDAVAWFEPSTTNRYRVALLDPLGQEIALLHDGMLAVGKHGIQVPLSVVPAGAYTVVARSTQEFHSVQVLRVP
ncbi:MAG: M20/M25/M40 family metallo-hydrolase [Flavobacteriales bacterium]|nr:M20/M25/M40 family metallo-hydrolase [Flavobacteriales bacterium]